MGLLGCGAGVIIGILIWLAVVVVSGSEAPLLQTILPMGFGFAGAAWGENLARKGRPSDPE